MYKIILPLLLVFSSVYAQAQTLHKSHAIAMHGEPALTKDFAHLPYANPKAVKGGDLRLAYQGTFDSLNPYIVKGNAADNLWLIYDTLTVQSNDEAFTEYGLLAETIEWPEDRSWVSYDLRKNAYFHDGKAITAEDVAFTFELLMKHGSPGFKAYYAGVDKVSVISKHKVRFDFKEANNRELVLIVGQLPVLPKHFWEKQDFDQSSLEIPLGSGPYRVDNVDAGKSISYQRVDNYWAKDLPINRGLYNFDTIRIDYYRDPTVLLEALKAHKYDMRLENIAKQWASAYTGNAIDSGKLKKELITHENPVGLQSFVFNLRKPLFSDIRVRKALAYAFDFEWSNKTLFYNSYKRSNSFYTNSELASSGLPSTAELALLEPLKDKLPASVFTERFAMPETDGSGNNRQQLRIAKQLFEEAGWTIKNRQLVNADGQVFQFEFLVYDSAFERLINPFIQNLKRLGIEANINRVEISQYINRMRSFNFDISTMVYPQSLSPGNEQVDYFHSSSAAQQGSRNYGGISNPAIDQLIQYVINADDREQLITATHALDRALLHNWYVIPQYYIDAHRVAYWDIFSRPDKAPKYDPGFRQALQTWWIKSDN